MLSYVLAVTGVAIRHATDVETESRILGMFWRILSREAMSVLLIQSSGFLDIFRVQNSIFRVITHHVMSEMPEKMRIKCLRAPSCSQW